MAIDDKIIEDPEVFTLIIDPTNSLDNINGNTTIIVLDNDSEEDIAYKHSTCTYSFTNVFFVKVLTLN